jgi:S1-C subfamily serine protease
MWIWLTTLVLVVLLSLSGVVVASPVLSAPPADDPAVAPVTASSEVAALQATLVGIYDQVSPSVVSIQVVKSAAGTMQGAPDQLPFFGLPDMPQERFSRGSGSGFIWDTQGHIVTNNHVIEGASKISVIFSDGTTVAAETVGTDPDSDLAVVRVKAPSELLKPVVVADSTQVKVGHLAVAIGNPFGLQGTMTVGFISSLGRLLPVDPESPGAPRFSIPDVIQTDAPINPGNSGGALVDYEGRLIGVTTAIISPMRASASIGFAVPSVIVQKVVPALIADGSYEHPWLGVSGTSLNPDLAQAMDLDAAQRGALVVDVTHGGPADKAGLRGSDREITIEGQTGRVGGDVITAINGQPVRSFDDVVTYIARFGQAGQAITLSVLRDGAAQEISVTLEARPGPSEAAARQPERARTGGAWLGIAGQTVTPDIAAAMGLSPNQTGVLVGQVTANGPADKAGLRGSYKPATINGERVLVGGDIITAFDGKAITSMEDLVASVRAASAGDSVTLTVLREGESLDVAVTLGERPVQ